MTQMYSDATEIRFQFTQRGERSDVRRGLTAAPLGQRWPPLFHCTTTKSCYTVDMTIQQKVDTIQQKVDTLIREAAELPEGRRSCSTHWSTCARNTLASTHWTMRSELRWHAARPMTGKADTPPTQT
jgi:hypothetical protein